MEKLEGRDLFSRKQLMDLRINLTKNEEKDLIHNQLLIIDDALDTFPDQDYFIHHRTDKNGRSRFAPIIGEQKSDIINRMRNTAPNEKVWLNVPTNADIHGYRSDYATTLYKMYARPIESIPYDKTNKGTGRN